MRHTFFISDLHLEPQRPDITHCFLDFLRTEALKADALYLLGDFFEVWIGDDEQSDFHHQIIQALKTLTDTGFPVYFMHGNRDFLIGEKFLAATGCCFLKDPSVITLYEKKILLTHGDCLCIADISYQRFKKYAQNPRYSQFFLGLPLWFRLWVARKMRTLSQRHTTRISHEIMDVSQTAVIDFMQQYGVTQMIHGHTHRPKIHHFQLSNQAMCRIVLSDWHHQGGILRYNEDQKMVLMTRPFSTIASLGMETK